MDTFDGPRRVAIACQGGGSHTAFTAGVLKRLLREDELRRYRVVGLSGTSGGAVCALLAWYALIDDVCSTTSGPTTRPALLTSSSSMPGPWGVEAMRRFVVDHMTSDAAVDLTRKQVARNSVAWTVRTERREFGRRVEGRAEAVFCRERVVNLRFGTATSTST